MATKPKFSPDQDMENVTPQDVRDAKTRAKERQAYKESSNIGDTNEGPSIGKRIKDTVMNATGKVVKPVMDKVIDANEYLDKKSEGVLSKEQRSRIFGNPSEDRGALDKASRENTKDSYKKGGSVSSASSRADGIAQRGKTRGMIV